MTPHLMGALPQGRGWWGRGGRRSRRWGPRAVGSDSRPWYSQARWGPVGEVEVPTLDRECT